MKVLLLGATGMVGQGVLRECIADGKVTRVVTLGRSRTGQQHEKLTELVHSDLLDLSAVATELSGLDACLFCLGVSSAGMSEEAYSAVTYDITIAVARTLAKLNAGLTFIYVSGAGTDSSEHGRAMWARVKGRTENALLQMPFKGAYMFRPGLIYPLHGIRSKTRWYRVIYSAMKPFYPIMKAIIPNQLTTTEQLGRAMVKVAKQGFSKPILETSDINDL